MQIISECSVQIDHKKRPAFFLFKNPISMTSRSRHAKAICIGIRCKFR